MIKKALVSLAIVLLPVSMFAQVEDNPELLNPALVVHSRGDFSISGSPDILLDTPNGNILAGGLKIRMFLGKRFSFDSDLIIGRHFAQFAPGIIGIPIVLIIREFGFETSDQSFSEFLLMGALVLLSVEHFAWHIPVKGHTDISPYMSLLRFRQFDNAANSVDDNSPGASACFAAGLELNRYFGRFIFSPYGDYTIGYSGGFRGFTFGINLGLYLPSK